MTTIELKAFRKTLEQRQGELAVGNREALAIEASPDEMDRVQHFSEREYAMNNLERNSRRLREVRHALSRMDDGTFGICVDCEEKIGARRLAVMPWAATCITCQEAAEREQETSGDEERGSEEEEEAA
jgi:DnaK suppressor protein